MKTHKQPVKVQREEDIDDGVWLPIPTFLRNVSPFSIILSISCKELFKNNKMKIAALIPARLESTRFPGKLLQKIGSKSIIRHVHDNMIATRLFDHVGVVCNHLDIYSEITDNGGVAYMSQNEHDNGTARISEIAKTQIFQSFSMFKVTSHLSKAPYSNLNRHF
jgi:hypothetical protein